MRFLCVGIWLIVVLGCFGVWFSIRSCEDQLIARRTFVAEQCRDVADIGYRDCKQHAMDTFHRMQQGEQ